MGRARKRAGANGNGANIGYEEKLWAAADKLRGHMDASEYKHVVLGLIFLKYISDSFQEKFEALQAEEYADPEDRDEYLADNVFWLPAEARWQTLRDRAKDPSIGQVIDNAMLAIERENPRLKGVLPRNYGRPDLDKQRLGEVVDLISDVGVGGSENTVVDALGRVYEYFLGRFAAAEGRAGGEFYTAQCIVQLLVEMLQPYKGRVYDPCCGSGGMFVQSERFVEEHGGKVGDIAIYGQESNPTTWRLARMNLAIRGIDADLGPYHADTFRSDLHKDLRADFILANPPFNVSDWGGDQLKDDVRWKYGAPPAGNANYAWMQHMIHHLAPGGALGLVLANGSMSSSQSDEGEIRRGIVEADLVDCMVALPGQLFYTTTIPVCLWFLRKGKPEHRRGQTLFIDARKMGYMEDRTHRNLSAEDIARIADTYRAWRGLTPQPPLPTGEGGKVRVRGVASAEMVEAARRLRQEQSPPEEILWECLRGRRLRGLKFRRQHPIGRFVLDFYCDAARLAVEVDGAHHEEQREADAERDSELEARGIATVRLPAKLVLEDVEEALARIVGCLTPHPPLPQGEGEEARSAGGGEAPTPYDDIPGFCYSAPLEEIASHGHVLTPGRYVGVAPEEDDGEPFEEKMARLTATLLEQFEESRRLEDEIRANLEGLGYG
jgi:type I restriction enzyme M protein